AALENSKAGGATIELLAFLEERLVADANPEEGPAGLDEFARAFQQLLPAHGVDAIVEGPHARQHSRMRAGQFFRPPHYAHIATRLEQRFLHAAQVAGAIVHQRNHGRRIISDRGKFNGSLVPAASWFPVSFQPA